MTADVFRLASGSAATPVSLGNVHVGTALSGNIAVTNTAANDGFSEKLNASVTGTGGDVASASGAVNGLGAGQTNSTGITASLNTSTAGAKSGTATLAFASDGTGIDGGAPVSAGSQSVTVNGKVYTPAVAAVQTGSVNFGIVHVGDGGGQLSQSVAVKNDAQVTALNDVLTGSIAAGAAPFSGNGTLGAGLGAQQSSSALQVGLDTSNAGIFSGSADLALASHDTDLADLALVTAPVQLDAQINNYAKLGFLNTGGIGNLSGGGNMFTLDFGTLLLNSGTQQTHLSFLNDNPLGEQTFTDLLSSSLLSSSSTGFTLGGQTYVLSLAGGESGGGFDIGFDTSMLGSFRELLSFNVDSSNSSGFDQTIDYVTLALAGRVTSSTVPEPPSLPLELTGLVMLGFAYWRRMRRSVR